ncbi:MAG: hypothetical protein ABJI96_17640 [Paracoccaceae bacterium]
MNTVKYTACAALTALSTSALAQIDLEYGAYLGSECITCHQIGAANAAIPSITGLRVAHFCDLMRQYRSKERENPTMQMIAGRLTDDDIVALAAYFGNLE